MGGTVNLPRWLVILWCVAFLLLVLISLVVLEPAGLR